MQVTGKVDKKIVAANKEKTKRMSQIDKFNQRYGKNS